MTNAMSDTKKVVMIILGAVIAGFVVFAIWFWANYRF